MGLTASTPLNDDLSNSSSSNNSNNNKPILEKDPNNWTVEGPSLSLDQLGNKTTATTEPDVIPETNSSSSSSSSNSCLNNDGATNSSDDAEMDDSWYIIPPPCFTGANKLNEPQPLAEGGSQPEKAVEAARENELIEHPAIPIPRGLTSGRSAAEVAAAGLKKSQQKLQQQQQQLLQAQAKRAAETAAQAGAAAAAAKATVPLPNVGTHNQENQMEAGQSAKRAKPAKGKKNVRLSPIVQEIEPRSMSASFWAKHDDNEFDEDYADDEAWNIDCDMGERDQDYDDWIPASGKRTQTKKGKRGLGGKKASSSPRVVRFAKASAVATPAIVPPAATAAAVTMTATIEVTATGSNSKNKKKLINNKPSVEAELKVPKNEDKPVEFVVNKQQHDESGTKQKKGAWKNKFSVSDDWHFDDREDADSDFDCMFEPEKKRNKAGKKQSKERKQQKQLRKLKEFVVVKEENDLLMSKEEETNGDSVSIEEIPTTETIANNNLHEQQELKRETKQEIEQDEADGAELISMRVNSSFDSLIEEDNAHAGRGLVEEPFVLGKENNGPTMAVERRPPTQVRPIEPERRPGWQLKRQRSKRRSISSSGPSSSSSPNSTIGGGDVGPAVGYQAPSAKHRATAHKKQRRQAAEAAPAGGRSDSPSSSSSVRSTPTLIDRIGSSIVANINNLTNGLVASGAINSASNGPSVVGSAGAGSGGASSSVATDDPQRRSGAQQGALACRPILAETCNLVTRKRMSKSFLKRQNICAMQANSQRRPDRRLKMFATPNGCSINRKVQSNFH